MDIQEHKHKENEQRHPWELARLEVVSTLIRSQGKVDKPYRILDIGCGDTFVVSQLQKKMPQSQFYAIDTAFTSTMMDEFQQEGIALYQNINDLEPELEAADMVLLMDVIEHIEDDSAFLQDLLTKKFITPQTLFLITVPAYQSLFSAHDDFLQHYRRYSRRSLEKLIKNQGMQIIQSGNFFSSLLLPRILSVTKEAILGKPKVKGLATWNGSSNQSILLKEILLLDFKTTHFFHRMGVKLPGLSTYALCQKSVL